MRRLFVALWVLSGVAVGIAFAKPPANLKFPSLDFVPPKVEKTVLSNGTTVFLLPDHELPLVNITAVIRTGTMYDSPDKVGLASLSGNQMRAGGTKTRKSEEIDEELEFLGASVETGIDTEQGSASLSVLSKDLDRGLEIFADVLMNPAFRKKKLDIEKARVIETIRRRNDRPFGIARREFRKMLYGTRHPLSRTGEIPVIRSISRRDLVRFHRRYFHPNNMMLAVSGDFDRDSMVASLERVFRDWKPMPVEFPPVVTVQNKSAAKRVVGLAEKDLSQTSIIVGHLGIKRHNPDRFKLEVMNEILGGGSLSSRLYKEVRSRQGLAYWVGSSISEPWDYGVIAAGCQTKNQTVGKAIESIIKEIVRIREEKVSNEELEVARDSIINSFVFRYASARAIVSQKMSLEYYSYPSDYLELYPGRIADVTREDVLAVAQKYLKPDSLNVILVGKEKEFDVAPDTLGSVRRIDLRIPQ